MDDDISIEALCKWMRLELCVTDKASRDLIQK